MATISTPLPAATPAPALAGTVVQLRPANLNFEVVDHVKLATKVNGAAQYIFKVEFHPSGHPETAGAERFTAEIPLHAPTLEEALVILQAYGSSLRDKTPAQFRDIMDRLAYSAVEIGVQDKKGDYQVKFSEYNARTHRFHPEVHIDYKMTSALQTELKQYARVLESRATAVPPDTAVEPQVTLGSSSGVTPVVSLTPSVAGVQVDLHAIETPAARRLREHTERVEKFNAHKAVIERAVSSGYDGTEADLRATLDDLGELFGRTFFPTLQRNLDLPLGERLTRAAFDGWFDQEEDTIAREAVLGEVLAIVNTSPDDSVWRLAQLSHLIDVLLARELAEITLASDSIDV